MKQAMAIRFPESAWHVRFFDAIVRMMVTIAMGIYAIYSLAVAVDWGLESVFPIQDSADDPR